MGRRAAVDAAALVRDLTLASGPEEEFQVDAAAAKQLPEAVVVRGICPWTKHSSMPLLNGLLGF